MKLFALVVSGLFLIATVPTYAKAGGSGSHASSRTAKTSSGARDHVVHGYIRKNGTYVAPYHATNPNHTRNDNYSTQGNVNPYTGKAGTKPGER